MSYDEFKEGLRQSAEGREMLEAQEQYAEKFDKFDQNAKQFVVWLTGIAGGELVFVLSNLTSIFKEKDSLFRFTMFSLLVCVISGLLFHLLRILYLYSIKDFHLAYNKITIELWCRSIDNAQDVDKSDKSLSKIKKLGKKMELALWNWIIFEGMDWVWKCNSISFFISSIALVILVYNKVMI